MSEQQRQINIAEFLLQQRQLMDQIKNNYETVISQYVQQNEQLKDENEQLKNDT